MHRDLVGAPARVTPQSRLAPRFPFLRLRESEPGELSFHERLLLRLTARYVELEPRLAFRYLFDGRQYGRLDNADETLTVRLRKAEETCRRIFTEGSLALGECYCEGLIESEDARYHEFLLMLIRAVFDPSLRSTLALGDRLRLLGAGYRGAFFTYHDAAANINSHYSLRTWFHDDEAANRFYLTWLDSPYIQYSCGCWTEETRTLEEAQERKFELYLARLGGGAAWSGRRILDLGCGWGGFLFYAAERHGADVTGITLSTAQARYIEREIERRGLRERARVIVGNALELEGTYDAIISVGLLEHIDDYETLFARAARALRPNGAALFHAMFHDGLVYKADPWLVRYIFPGGAVPGIRRIMRLLECRFRFVERQDLPALSYPRTLACWFENFCRHESEIRVLLEGSRCGNVDYAVRIFKHYLALARAGLTVNGIVSHLLAREPRAG